MTEPDEQHRPRHFALQAAPGRAGWRRWAAPGILAAVAVLAGVGAAALDRKPSGTPVGINSAETPVLSARRVPEVVAAPLAEKRLRRDLDTWLDQSPPDSCLAVEWAGSPVFEHRATEPVTGASTHKLLTATGLLLALGPDTVLETRVVAGDTPRAGVISGDVHLVGGGDALLATAEWTDRPPEPSTSFSDIDELARAVADAGVTKIEGSVVGDSSRYDDVTYHPAWPQRFLDQAAVGPIAGLIVNDGFSSFPAEGIAGMTAADDPATHAARVLTERLEAHGVAVTGAPRAGEAPGDTVDVARLASLPVHEIVTNMLSDSDNETSELALKELGYRAEGEGSWTAGASALTDVLAGAGVPLEGVSIIDGSGLSVENQLTCTTLVEVLTRPDTGPATREALAVAGETGTLRHRWRDSDVEGRLRAKTGTLRNVTALAGEVETLQGGTVTFAYVTNVADPDTVTPGDVDQDRLAEILTAHPRDIDLAELEPLGGRPAPRPDPGGSMKAR